MNNLPLIKHSLVTVLNSNIFITFLGLIVFDIFTGITLAFKNNVVNSKISKDGITKHFIIITFVIFFSCLFVNFKMNEFSKIIIYFYISSYGLSIFENLTMLGVPFPKWLQEKFLILRDESNKGDKYVIEKIEE